MFHVDNNTGVPVMPPVAAELSKTTLYFTEGGNGIPPTYPGPDWFNIVQSELLKILEEAGITPDKADTGQIMAALKKLFITNSGSAGAIAGLTGQENTFPYFTGEDAMALTPLSAFVRGILGKTSASEFVKSISAGCASSGSVAVGGDNGNWTTAQFIEWLESQGAFNHPYWMCKGSWYYAGNKIITDTGCGNIQLAGAVVEVMGTKSAMTIRVTTPTTAPNGTPGAQFTYINHGDSYSPGWRRDWNRGGDTMTGELLSTSANAFRMIYGNYGAFWRNDGNNVYLLLTDSGDQRGSWNSLRPFSVNLSTGKVTIGHSLAVNGTVTPTDYSNFDSRYLQSSAGVQDIRLGSYITHTMSRNSMFEYAGYVITGLGIIGEVDGDDPARLRPLQKKINGTWYNVETL